MQRIALSLIAAAALLPVVAPGQTQPFINSSWLPVSDEDLASKAPVVEKDAGIEALFWRIHVADEFKGQDAERVLFHYVRLKVFSEKGKEKAATIEIPFSGGDAIQYITGRTISPNGTIIELKKDAIFERDSVRSGRVKRKVKSFAMPGVEPGAIVEYRWKEVRARGPLLYMRLQMQREYPVRKVTYLLKPLPREYTGGFGLSVWPFNCKPVQQTESTGFHSISLDNVPAYKEEPMMPGDGNVRPWVLAFYHTDSKRDPDKYWNEVGKKAYGSLKSALKVNDEIRAATAKAIKDATTDEAKVRALIGYIRQNLRGFYDRRVTDAERTAILKQMPKDRVRTSAEVFKSGIGTSDELNTLFAGMASHAGLEARPAMVANRDDVAFAPNMTDMYFLPNIDMAISVNGEWRVFDVSARRLPPDMVGWREEGAQVLLCDPKKPTFVLSRTAPPEASATERIAKMTLSEDGTLEGDIVESLTGHVAEQRRSELEDQSSEKQTEDIKRRITSVFPQAEVSTIKVEGVDLFDKPVVIRYHVKVKQYAQRTSRRLLVQPLFFQRGMTPLFESNARRYAVVFPYAYREHDVVLIKAPSGFVLDNAENPGPLKFGKPGEYNLLMGVSPQRELRVERDLIFGREGIIQFPQKSYETLKRVFDEIHSRDNVALSLKQAVAEGGK
jgi:hypothetical protein